jgi:hypothetical protein
MFCQHCGAETPPDLKYCKRCGGTLNHARTPDPPARPALSPAAVWGIGATTILLVLGGLGMLFGFLFGMTRRGLPAPVIVMLAICGALTILISAALLMRFWRLLLTGGHVQAQPRPAEVLQQASYELPPRRPSAITEAFGHVPSITEHTTRTFDPAYRESRDG